MPKRQGDVVGSDAGPRPRLLVVDDDKAIRSLLTTVLSRKGYSVEIARNGEEAIEIIAENSFAAILLDLMMPKVDGFEVIEHMARTIPEQLRRCVIVLTAVASKDLKKLDGSRVFRVLRKPFDLNELLSVVGECIERNAD
jgi:two-component system response regulator MprA